MNRRVHLSRLEIVSLRARGLCLSLVLTLLMEPRDAFAQLPAANDIESPTDGPQQPLRGYFAMEALSAQPFWGKSERDVWGYGFSFRFGLGWGQIPLTLGADVQGAFYRRGAQQGAIDLDGQTLEVRVSRRDQAVFCHGWLRLQWPRYRVRPYAEGVVGFKALATESSLSFAEGEGTSIQRENEAVVSSMGLGGGVEVVLAQKGPFSSLHVVLGYRWLYGSRSAVQPWRADVAETSVGEKAPTTLSMITLGIAASWDLLAEMGDVERIQ